MWIRYVLAGSFAAFGFTIAASGQAPAADAPVPIHLLLSSPETYNGRYVTVEGAIIGNMFPGDICEPSALTSNLNFKCITVFAHGSSGFVRDQRLVVHGWFRYQKISSGENPVILIEQETKIDAVKIELQDPDLFKSIFTPQELTDNSSVLDGKLVTAVGAFSPVAYSGESNGHERFSICKTLWPPSPNPWPGQPIDPTTYCGDVVATGPTSFVTGQVLIVHGIFKSLERISPVGDYYEIEADNIRAQPSPTP